MLDMEDYIDEDGTFDEAAWREDFVAEKADRWIKEQKEEHGSRWFEYGIKGIDPRD